jgi:plasmid stabilization system protein ParE
MNFRILPAALADAYDVADGLESEQTGYGVAFTDLFTTATADIRANPRLYPRTGDGPRRPETREYYIARFRQRVIYAVTATEIVILAVVHARRRPRSWVRRLRDMN